MKSLRFFPKKLNWQLAVVLMLVVLMLAQVVAVSWSVGVPGAGLSAPSAVAFEPIKPLPPSPPDDGGPGNTTYGYGWGG